MQRIDHIVYGVPDLTAGVAELERRTGVRADVVSGPEPAPVALLDTPRGRVELR